MIKKDVNGYCCVNGDEEICWTRVRKERRNKKKEGGVSGCYVYIEQRKGVATSFVVRNGWEDSHLLLLFGH